MKNTIYTAIAVLVTLLSSTAAFAQDEVDIQPGGSVSSVVQKAFVTKDSSSKFKGRDVSEAIASSFEDLLEDEMKRRGFSFETPTVRAKLLIATNANRMDWFRREVGSSKKKIDEAKENEAFLNLPQSGLYIISQIKVSLTERKRSGSVNLFGIKPSGRQRFYVLAIDIKAKAITSSGGSAGDSAHFKAETDVMLDGSYKLSVVGRLLKIIPTSHRVGEYDESSRPDLAQRVESLLEAGAAFVGSRVGLR